MKIKTKLFALALSAISLTTAGMTVHAAPQNYVYIDIYCSPGIVPQGGDEFVITFGEKGVDGGEFITVDAGEYFNSYCKVPVARPGEYEIKDIAYAGHNSAISTYAMPRIFTVGEEDAGISALAIGEKEVEKMNDQYADVLTRTSEDPVKIPSETEDGEWKERPETEPDRDADEPDEEAGNPDEDEKAVKEETKAEEKQPYKENPLIKGLPLLAGILIASVAVFIMHKKGKI